MRPGAELAERDEPPRCAECVAPVRVKRVPVVVHPDADAVPVVQPRALELGVGEVKAERADEVEGYPGRGARSRDRAGVARDLRRDEDDGEVRSLAVGRDLDGSNGVQRLSRAAAPWALLGVGDGDLAALRQ